MATDGSCGARDAGFVGVSAVWREELERAVRPVLVVVLAVHAQHSFEVSTPEDEDPIETVVADRAYPALGERVRVRRLHGRPDYFDSLAAKDVVESPVELSVPVVNQQPERPFLLAQLHREVARLLRRPGSGGFAVQAMNSTRRVGSERKKSTWIRRSPTVSTVQKSQASTLAAC